MSNIRWMLPLGVLQIGADGATTTARSSSLDEAITPTNFNAKDNATFGVSNVEPAKIDEAGVYIDRSTWRPYQVAPNESGTRYASKSLVRLHRNIGKPGIIQIAVQRQPDTRAYMVRSDGQCIVLLYDSQDNAIGWSRIITDGKIESCEVLPGVGGDKVYFIVARQILGVTRRSLEVIDTWTDENAADANPVDCYVRQNRTVATDTITGLAHIEGREVVVWGDGASYGTHIVTGGQVQISKACFKLVAGLPYDGLYVSAGLHYGAQAGTAHTTQRRPMSVSFQLLNALPGGLEYGQSFAEMDRLQDRDLEFTYDAGPGMMSGVTDRKPMPGGHSRDPRIYLRASSLGGPVTVQGMVFGLQTNEVP
jgi:hypothetical protein